MWYFQFCCIKPLLGKGRCEFHKEGLGGRNGAITGKVMARKDMVAIMWERGLFTLFCFSSNLRASSLLASLHSDLCRVRVLLLNARSVKSKTSLIQGSVLDEVDNLAHVTDTWVDEAGGPGLSKPGWFQIWPCSTPGYCFLRTSMFILRPRGWGSSVSECHGHPWQPWVCLTRIGHNLLLGRWFVV